MVTQSELKAYSIAELQEAFSNGLTIKQNTEDYLGAIKKLDPQLNAICALNENAIEDATQLDVSQVSSTHLRL